MYIHAVGRRKTAVARVHLRPAGGEKGAFVINGKFYDKYFTVEEDLLKLMQPFKATGEDFTKYNIKVNVVGGGVTGQVEATRLALSRALAQLNEDYIPLLKQEGLLTVDSRQVERKKYGHRKARKVEQYSKR